MNTNWWRTQDELDDDQRKFIVLPPTGKYLLQGPPGSGKTNLLLLRAQFIAGSGNKNVLIVTFTRGLVDFIRSGIGKQGLISPTQVRTFHSWASEHIMQHLGKPAIPKDDSFDDAARNSVLELILEANKKIPTPKLYSAIFVDEAQDFTAKELESLLCLSDNICICGDIRQNIYDGKNGLDVAFKLGLTSHTLKRHFRIGQHIARVADRLIKPADGEDSLETTSNYNPKIQGESSANMHVCANRDEQFSSMIGLIRVQLEAFKGDTIGIFCKKDSLLELKNRFDNTDLKDLVCAHVIDDSASFTSDKPIHLLTIHSAKGTEFRAVHMFGSEDLKDFPLNRRKLGYTAITRAKTALNAYRTGDTNKPLEEAFAEPKHIDLSDLF